MKIARIITIVVLIALIGNSIMMALAANSGGKIRHTEIRDANDHVVDENE